MSDLFKQCTLCGLCWSTQEEFLAASDLELIGYQANFEHLSAGYLLFTHSCGTTIAVAVRAFENLYDGKIFTTRATGGNACPGYCLHRNELEPCPVACECGYVREIMQKVKHWPQRDRSAA